MIMLKFVNRSSIGFKGKMYILESGENIENSHIKDINQEANA